MCCPLATDRTINGIFFADYKVVLPLLGNAILARVNTMQTVKPKNLMFRSVGNVPPGIGAKNLKRKK